MKIREAAQAAGLAIAVIAGIAMSDAICSAADAMVGDKDTLQLLTFDGGHAQTAKGGWKLAPTGGVQQATGKSGEALLFNGRDGKVAVNASQQTRIAGDAGFSIEAWVQVYKQGQTQPIVSAPPFVELEVRSESGAVSYNLTAMDGSANVRATGKTRITDGLWHHVAGVRDPQSKKVRVYIDGKLDAEVDDTTAGKELVLAEAFLLGSNASGSETLGGMIDDLRISNTAREISAKTVAAEAVQLKPHVLENEHVKFTFLAGGGNLSLGGLYDKQRGVEFVADNIAAENLWQASLNSADGMAILNPSGSELDVKTDKNAAGQKMTFTWKGLKAGNDDKAIDVIVTVELPNDSSIADWRIKMDNHSKTYGVWTAIFPRINNLAKLSADGKDVMAIPGGNGGGAGEGQLYADPFKTITHPFVRTYPCYHQSMQFNAYYNDKAGLYLATHDGKMNLKGFLMQPFEGETPHVLYEVYHYPADSGIAGTGIDQDYPHLIGPYKGDWYDAAQIYRQWALKQVWAQAGPLSKRKDIASSIRNGAYWMVGTFEWEPIENPLMRKPWRDASYEEAMARRRSIDVEASMKRVRDVHNYFGFPIILWTNEWFDGGGDISPPRYIPMGNLDKYMQKIHDEFDDVYVSGHMQMKRFSVQIADYTPEIQKSIEFTPDGKMAIEPLGAMDAGDQIAYPCWYTDTWYNFWSNKAKQIVTQTGLDGFHCDELASATLFEQQCFNPNHGHPIGGGTLYADTRRKNTRMLRDSARSVNPDFALHHEALSEIFIDLADLAEVDTTPSGNNAPIWEAVYHDYVYVMGRRIHPWMDRRTFQDFTYGDAHLDEFTSSFAQTFVWGNQPGWQRLDILEYSPKAAEIIKQFMDVRYRNMKFLNIGRFIRPLIITEALETKTIHWTTCDTPEVTLPVVLNSVWQAEDGSIGIVLANHTDTPQTVKYKYDLAEAGGSARQWKLARTDSATPEEIGVVEGDALERSDEVPARSVIVIQATPVR